MQKNYILFHYFYNSFSCKPLQWKLNTVIIYAFCRENQDDSKILLKQCYSHVIEKDNEIVDEISIYSRMLENNHAYETLFIRGRNKHTTVFEI